MNLDLVLFYQKNPRVMPSSLRKLCDALKTISPNSIDLEKTFSVMGFYVTKSRCSLGDQSEHQCPGIFKKKDWRG